MATCCWLARTRCTMRSTSSALHGYGGFGRLGLSVEVRLGGRRPVLVVVVVGRAADVVACMGGGGRESEGMVVGMGVGYGGAAEHVEGNTWGVAVGASAASFSAMVVRTECSGAMSMVTVGGSGGWLGGAGAACTRLSYSARWFARACASSARSCCSAAAYLAAASYGATCATASLRAVKRSWATAVLVAAVARAASRRAASVCRFSSASAEACAAAYSANFLSADA